MTQKRSTRELIAILLGGGQLNALESAELAAFDPDALGAELEEAKRRLEEHEKAKMNSEEALRHDLAEAAAERDTLRRERDTLRRRQRIAELAAQSGCEDPDYLDFLAGRAGIDLDDAGAVAGFLAEAEKTNPHCFRTSLRPGGGSGLPAESAGSDDGSLPVPPADRIERLIADLGDAPETADPLR